MCAAIAGQRGKRILVIDHAEEAGKKILISGGGRCNFTNIHTAPDRYLSANPHFAKSALGRYTPQDFLALVERHGIAWHEKTLGQLFCDQSARQIVAMLLAECEAGGVAIRLNHSISAVTHAYGRFTVTHGGRIASAPALVIATGGPAIPKIGATGFAYDLARQFGLKIVEPRPALVPLTLGGEDLLFRSLSGVSTPVIARHGKTAFREAALLTHRGLSGPAILQISSYWRHGGSISLDFLPDAASHWLTEAKRTKPRASIAAVLRPCRTPRASRRPRQHPRPKAGGSGAPPRRLVFHPQWHGRLRQGRSHHRRHLHSRTLLPDNGSPPRSRSLRHRRSGRCHRLAGRL
jgi:predicted Rossmann fold flavoprotein